MAASPALNQGLSSDSRLSVTTDFATQIAGRESKELVLAVSGPVGSGQAGVVAELERQLLSHGYKPVTIKLSTFLDKMISEGRVAAPAAEENRYSRLQSAGNSLRKAFDNAILAELAIAKIASMRLVEQGEDVVNGTRVPAATAWIIDQLKHPEEVAILSKIYRDIFFLIGVFSHEQQRLTNIQNELAISKKDAEVIVARDREENFSHGQKLDKTLLRADYFIRSLSGTHGHVQTQVRRFIDLIHAKNGITPTCDESGMYAAYAAAMRSACLSRQVGAAITGPDGCVLATGCNDVPKSGGGLYSEADNPDHRCFNKGLCFNDKHKLEIERQIKDLLAADDSLKLSGSAAQAIARKLREFTRIRDLIEFSRSVHAEMDAIVSMARNGGVSTCGCSLYTTTFPCHNCARHIVAAGISRVLFIEPYEKSLASDLHGEDIAFVEHDGNDAGPKVKFLHFEGVAPKRFQSFFLSTSSRKNTAGRSIAFPLGKDRKAAPVFLDRYFDYEKKVSELVSERGLSPISGA